MTTNYREILRLDSLGLNKTDIASAAQCARNTVSTTLARAKACGLQWPLPEGMSDKELAEKLFPCPPGKVVYKMPDYAHVHREMQRQGVTLTLLWLEYCDQCCFLTCSRSSSSKQSSINFSTSSVNTFASLSYFCRSQGTTSPAQYFFTVFLEIPSTLAAVRWLVMPSSCKRLISL